MAIFAYYRCFGFSLQSNVLHNFNVVKLMIETCTDQISRGWKALAKLGTGNEFRWAHIESPLRNIFFVKLFPGGVHQQIWILWFLCQTQNSLQTFIQDTSVEQWANLPTVISEHSNHEVSEEHYKSLPQGRRLNNEGKLVSPQLPVKSRGDSWRPFQCY